MRRKVQQRGTGIFVTIRKLGPACLCFFHLLACTLWHAPPALSKANHFNRRIF